MAKEHRKSCKHGVLLGTTIKCGQCIEERNNLTMEIVRSIKKQIAFLEGIVEGLLKNG